MRRTMMDAQCSEGNALPIIEIRRPVTGQLTTTGKEVAANHKEIPVKERRHDHSIGKNCSHPMLASIGSNILMDHKHMTLGISHLP